MGAAESKARNFVARFWRGEYSLAVSYWLFGIGTNVVLYISGMLIGVVAITLGANEQQAVLVTLPTSATLMVWNTRGVWKSADNHVARTGRKFWAAAAKVVLVIGWLSVIGQIENALTHS